MYPRSRPNLGRIFCTAMVLCLVIGSAAVASAQPLYTAYNMWYELPGRMWTVNYKRGTLLPAGTKVRDVKISAADELPFPFIRFKRLDSDQEYRVYYRSKFHPGKSIEAIRDRMFTNKDFASQSQNLTAIEINAIRRGVLVPGMSKAAVILSYGIPPQHHTPQLSSNVWRYWTSRLISKNICFDANERTIKCQQLDTL